MRISVELNKDTVFFAGIVIMLICMAMMSKSSTIIASIIIMLTLTIYYYLKARNNSPSPAEGLCSAYSEMRSDMNYKDSGNINIPITTIINEPASEEECDRSGFLDRAMDSGRNPVDGYMSVAEQYPTANKNAQALAGEGKPGTESYDKQYPWGSNQDYTDCYPGPNRELNGCNINAYVGIDEANTRQVSMRTRDKKVIDGAVTKNANYYKKNFGKELDEAENKRWWGNDEF